LRNAVTAGSRPAALPATASLHVSMRGGATRPAAVRRLLIGIKLSDIAVGGAPPPPQFGGALHSTFSGLWHVGADRPFGGVALNKMRHPGAQRGFKRCRVENDSRSFHTPREPQQSTGLGPPHDKVFCRSKDGTFPMRLPSELGGARAPTAATSLMLTQMGHCRIRSCSFP
jgi:hypothetical protein